MHKKKTKLKRLGEDKDVEGNDPTHGYSCPERKYRNTLNRKIIYQDLKKEERTVSGNCKRYTGFWEKAIQNAQL